MSITKPHALILGASGLVGFHTTKLLLAQGKFDTVYAVSRRGIPLEDKNLKQIVAEYENIDGQLIDLQINHLFSCLGSTKKKTPHESDYIKIDHDYPLKVARILKKNGTEKMSIVSALGADQNAMTFYMKLKGRTEQSLVDINFDELYIMQPSLITGDRGEKRIAEGMASAIFKVINPLLVGSFKKYRSIDAESIAQALVKTTLLNKKGVNRFDTQQIKELA